MNRVKKKLIEGRQKGGKKHSWGKRQVEDGKGKRIKGKKTLPKMKRKNQCGCPKSCPFALSKREIPWVSILQRVQTSIRDGVHKRGVKKNYIKSLRSSGGGEEAAPSQKKKGDAGGEVTA